MPIYEYQCHACGHQLEAMQKFSETPLVECPACQRPALNRLVSATSFQLKGTGWYATDIRDKGKKPSTQNDGGTSSTTDSSNKDSTTG